MQGGLQPAARSNFALIAQPVRIAPTAAFHQESHRLLNLPLVRISFFDHRHWDAVRAENDFRSIWNCVARQRLVNLLYECIQIGRIPIESLDAMYWRLVLE